MGTADVVTLSVQGYAICRWEMHWLVSAPTDRTVDARVIEGIFPTFLDQPTDTNLAQAVASGDEAPIRQDVLANCSGPG